MAAGKNPYLRYRILNSCFTNRQHRYWTKEELIEALAKHDLVVEVRTLHYDIDNMRNDARLKYNAPIGYSKINKGYYYTDSEYSIDAIPLSAEELHSLSLAVNVIQQYKGAQFVKYFEGAIDKVVRIVDQVGKQSMPAQNCIEFERAPYYRGIEYLDDLHNAITHQQPLRITYHKFTAALPDDHVFHPYLLKEYKNFWYVLGYSETRQLLLTLALDRIEGIRNEPVVYKKNNTLSHEQYFKHTIGIMHAQGPIEDIVLWFTVNQGHYIKTQHLHHSQKAIQDDATGLTISLKLIVNYELISLLLSFCPNVSILQPLSLKNKLNELMGRGLEVNC